MSERFDYDANRGPLDGRQYTPRQPDGCSTTAGCLFILLWYAIAIGAIACLIVLVVTGGHL